MRKSAKRAIYLSAIAASAAGAVGYGRMRSKQTGVSNFSRLMEAGKKAVFNLKSQIRGASVQPQPSSEPVSIPNKIIQDEFGKVSKGVENKIIILQRRWRSTRSTRGRQKNTMLRGTSLAPW